MEEKDRSTSPIREEIQMISEDEKIRIPLDSAVKDGVNENEDKEKCKDEEKKKRAVGVFELFRFATKLDLLFMLFGAVAAVAHGVAFIFLLVVFGNTLDEFATFAGSIICGGNMTVNCTNRSNAEDQLVDAINHPIVYQYCMIGAIVALSGWIQVMLFQFAAARQVKKIRVAYFRSILKQEIAWFDLNPTGEINSRLNDDLEKVSNGLGDKLAFIFQALGSFFCGIIIGFFYIWELGLLVVGCMPIVITVAGIGQKMISKFTANEQAQYAGAGAIAEEVIGSVRTVVVYGGQEKEVSRYAELLKMAKKLGIKKEVISGIGIAVNLTILLGIAGLIYWFSAYLITNMSGISSGDVLITFFTMIMGAQILGHASPNFQDFATARGAAGEIYDTIDRVPEMDSTDTEKGLKPEKFDSEVTLSDVNFTYPSRPDVQVLDGLSISVSPGQTLALVGPSGCGKSTVVQLVQRFYDVSEGQVQVGGYNVKELNLPWLRERIGVVSQEPVLFATTIAENIRYGREGVTQREIEDAAKASNAHSFISELPDGYNTLVGERGAQLSGGQKQRVAIARALVRDPKILLLDEATSALDSESEAQVQAALDKARQGRTTIVVAHRLSTIQGADIIAAFANGKVVEKGTHSQLLQMRGVYYNLVTAQSYGEIENEEDSQIVSEMMKKYTRQTSTQDDVVKFEKQVSQQYSKQQSNTEETGKKENKDSEENKEELKELTANYSLGTVLWRSFLLSLPELPYVILGMIFSTAIGLVFPIYVIFFGAILDEFAYAETAEENSRPLAGVIVAIGALGGLSGFLRATFFGISAESLTARLREQSFKHILRQDMSWFDQPKNSTGKLTTRLSHDAAQVQGAIGVRLGLLVEIVVNVVSALIIALVYSWPLTLVIISALPIIAITQAFQGRVLAGVTASTKKGYEESSNIAYEAIVNIRTVASLNLEVKMGDLFEEKLKAPHKKSFYNAIFYGAMSGISDGLFPFIYAVVFRYGAFAVTVDSDNVASLDYRDLITVVIALVTAGFQSGRVSTFLPNYSNAILSARRVFQLLDTEPGIDSYSTEGLKPSSVNGELELEKLYFTYPSRPNVPVLQGLSVRVQPGQTLALVGPSGCGKSTVVSLLERLYDPDQGVLKFDREDLRSLNVGWLRKQIGLVSQEPVLFDTSIADNIRYGANFRDVSDEEVEAAAKSANIHNFISTLPQGYNTNAGAHGTQLSGGQKQRVAIARALIRDPKILLLDEATSALDTESEKVVQEALDSARKGRTSIVIAHRLSTIHNADHIAVIKDGIVIEAGTHSQLMEWKGAYYKLNQAQMLSKN